VVNATHLFPICGPIINKKFGFTAMGGKKGKKEKEQEKKKKKRKRKKKARSMSVVHLEG